MRVLVTGSTDGIGRETVRKLASLGYDIVVHGRSQQRTGDVAARIRNDYPDITCNGIVADLSSLKQVKRLADEIIHRNLIPDILINNAGIDEKDFALSKDGCQLPFAVNHLAHFYLTLLLLDNLPDNAKIINVSSRLHESVSKIDFENLNDKSHYNGNEAYSASKLCNVLFTYRLNRLLKGRRGITVNALHPGVINTKMLLQGWGPIGAPVKEGAKMLTYVAASKEASGISGAYFSDMRKQRSSSVSYDEKLQDECWKKSIELITLAGFEVPEINE